MSCSINVNDGVKDALMQGIPALAIDFSPIAEGGEIDRFLDGSAAKQQRWYKEVFTITGSGRTPVGLRDLDYSRLLTITVITGLGTDTYTGYSVGATESWSMATGMVSWSLSVEEN